MVARLGKPNTKQYLKTQNNHHGIKTEVKLRFKTEKAF